MLQKTLNEYFKVSVFTTVFRYRPADIYNAQLLKTTVKK
jgi:hypothetical protein